MPSYKRQSIRQRKKDIGEMEKVEKLLKER